jgi:hypothetical protein
MPVPCSQYPSPGYLFRCPIQQPYFFGYGSQYGPYRYYPPQSPSQPLPQQGRFQPLPQQGVEPAPQQGVQPAPQQGVEPAPQQGVQQPPVSPPAPTPTVSTGAPNIPGVPIVTVNPGGNTGSGQ